MGLGPVLTGPAQPRRARRRVYLGITVGTLAVLAVGCGHPLGRAARPEAAGVEEGALVTLEPGQAFRFVDHFRGGEAPADPELAGNRADGLVELPLMGLHRPVLRAPAPHSIRQPLRMPGPAQLRLAFGPSPASWNKVGAGIRFSVRLYRRGEMTELLSEEVGRWRGTNMPNWAPVTLEVPASEGEEVILELAVAQAGEPREVPAEQAIAAYALWVDPTIVAPAEQRPPNVVLVVIDALRPDHLGCYGYHRQTSPFIDRISQEGALFEQAHAQGTWTLPSMLSMLTSQHRFLVGARAAGPPMWGEPDELAFLQPVELFDALQDHLRAGGYATLGSVGGGFLDPLLGFSSGFDWYWTPPRPPVPAEHIVDQLADLQEALPAYASQPFFVLLHTYEAHNYFQGRFRSLARFSRGYQGPLVCPERLEEAVLSGRPDGLSEADLRFIRDVYDGEIYEADRWLERFCEWLFSHDWGRDTVLIITSDHGEAFGEHGRMHHGDIPYREVVQVPLIIRFPDGRARGRRVPEPVALVDLLPTVLGLAGLEPPQGLAGRSLLPLLEGEIGGARRIFAESRGGAFCAREGRWWYLTWAGGEAERLYDMARDPAQLRDLSATHAEQLRHMRQVFADLAMGAARGARLALVGPREEEVTVELRASAPFSYFHVPTLRESWEDRIAGPAPEGEGGDVARVRLPAGGDAHVVLFEAGDPEAAITLSARAGHQPVAPERFHLGSHGIAPDRVPVSISAETGWLMAEQPPVPDGPGDWGLWLWLPTARAHALSRVSAVDPTALREELKEELRALGYLR